MLNIKCSSINENYWGNEGINDLLKKTATDKRNERIWMHIFYWDNVIKIVRVFKEHGKNW